MKVSDRGDKLLRVLKEVPGEAIHVQDIGELAGFDMTDEDESKRVSSAMAYLATNTALGVARVRRGTYVYKASPSGRQALENDMATKPPIVPEVLNGVIGPRGSGAELPWPGMKPKMPPNHIKAVSTESPLPERDKLFEFVTQSANGRVMVRSLSEPEKFFWLRPV